MFMIGGFKLQNMKKGENKKMEVVYNVVYGIKDNLERTDKEIEDILTKKLLRVILNLENTNSVALNNS